MINTHHLLQTHQHQIIPLEDKVLGGRHHAGCI